MAKKSSYYSKYWPIGKKKIYYCDGKFNIEKMSKGESYRACYRNVVQDIESEFAYSFWYMTHPDTMSEFMGQLNRIRRLYEYWTDELDWAYNKKDMDVLYGLLCLLQWETENLC